MHDNEIAHILAQYKDTIGIILTGFAGSLTHIMNKIRKGEKVSLKSSLSHLFVSGFVGLMVYFLCVTIGIDGAYMAIMVGMSGYIGVKIIDAIDMINPAVVSDLIVDFLRYKLGGKK